MNLVCFTETKIIQQSAKRLYIYTYICMKRQSQAFCSIQPLPMVLQVVPAQQPLAEGSVRAEIASLP